MEIILKVTERCILSCKYCYFFRGGDLSYKEHPPYISQEFIKNLCNFLRKGIKDLSIPNIKIVLHGGEPLLLGKKKFAYLCNALTQALYDIIPLKFSMQTNGLLIDEEWIELLIKHNVTNIGISIDGPKKYHDQNRIYPNGKGTYDNLIEKIAILQKNMPEKIGTLTVINHNYNGKEIYRHFVDELKINNFDFLLHDYHHEYKPNHDLCKDTEVLIDIFHEWVKDDDPNIDIRILRSFLGQLVGRDGLMYGVGSVTKNQENELPIITIRSSGDLEPVDELVSTGSYVKTNCNIFNTSLKNFLNHPIFNKIKLAQTILPAECRKCCWEKICGGGALSNRFSKQKGFDNPSVYCEGLKDFFTHLTAYLLNSGVSLSKIESTLFDS